MTDDESTHILSHNQTPANGSGRTSPNDMQHLVVMEEKKEDKQLFSLPMTSFNFINSIIGSGIIGIPYSLKQAGFGLGILVLCFVAFVSDYSVLLLVEGGGLSGTDSYQEVVLAAFGRPGFYVMTVLQFFYPFIAMVSYNVIIGDTITKIILWLNGNQTGIVQSILGNRQFVIAMVTLLITLPLSLYRNIGKLAKWALISIVMIVFITIAVGVRFTTFAKNIPPTEDAWAFANIGFFQAIGIVAFSFMCHHNTLLVHSSLERPTAWRWGLVVHSSVLFSMAMCLTIGVLGYLSFTGLTQGDLLENYCRDDVLMNFARLAFAITIMLTYPIECFVTREVVENAVFTSSEQRSPLWRHITVTVVIVLLAAAVSMSTDCVAVVLAFNGVLLAAPLAYIIPPCCVIRLKQGNLLSASNVGPALLATFGFLVMVLGTTVTVLDTINGVNTCSHGVEPSYCTASQANGSVGASSATTLATQLSTSP